MIIFLRIQPMAKMRWILLISVAMVFGHVSLINGADTSSLERTSSIPSTICTKSTLNYDCYLQDVQLSRNESNDYELTWKSNPQKKVTFENSRLAYLPKKLFEAFPKMELLNAEDLQIEEIESLAFNRAANLQRLYLKNNMITTIDNFVGASLLVYLDLSHNRIETIDKDAFKNNRKLQIILLNDNHLLELPNTHTIKNLQMLNASNNEISQIPNYQFNNNNELHTIDLSFNNLRLFNFDQLENNPKLHKIDVSHNKLESLYIPSQVKSLNAANNSIEYITLNECNVEKLDLSRNQIADVIALQICTNMKILDLSHNRLQSFDLIKSFNNLTILNLAHNELFEIDFPVKIHPLQVLDLSYNYLSYGPRSKFSNLKIIKLNNNKFIEFKFDSMGSLSYMLMSNNEWSCDKIKDINPETVVDGIEVCGRANSLHGICCKDYKRAFNDRLKEIIQETYLHKNVNAKDHEKCKHIKLSSREKGKPALQTLQIEPKQLDEAIQKLRNHYGVSKDITADSNTTLNRVVQRLQERNAFNIDLLARRKQEKLDTRSELISLNNTATAIMNENLELKAKLKNLKLEEAALKKERQRLEKAKRFPKS